MRIPEPQISVAHVSPRHANLPGPNCWPCYKSEEALEGGGAVAATMADVARLAGVSKKTVSNFFNGYRYMRADTRGRIEQAISDLNYKVNISARNLSSGKTGAIGLAVPELAHPYFAELSQSVVSAAQARGLNVLVEVTDGDREHELHILHGVRGRSVDGLIFAPIALSSEEIEAATMDVPLVLIGDLAYQGRFDFVGVPNETGAYEAVSYLLGSGRRRIVGLGVESPDAPTAAGQRHHGYLRALADHGISADPSLLIGPIRWNRSAGAEALGHLIDEGVMFDAVFGYNDALALGAMTALQRRGIVIPSSVAVIGFDNVEEAHYSTPALTTIESGRDWIARTAVERLAARLASGGSETVADLRMAEHSLVRRQSS